MLRELWGFVFLFFCFCSGAEFPALLHVIRQADRALLILLAQWEGGGWGAPKFRLLQGNTLSLSLTCASPFL